MNEQLLSTQWKSQSESGPQRQSPLAHSPSHSGLSPSQLTWQGPLVHSKSQLLPSEQVQSPLPHSASQVESSQVTWQGSLSHSRSQEDPGPQTQSPFAHAPSHSGLLPSHVTWHGGAVQTNAQDSPRSQSQLPLAHSDSEQPSIVAVVPRTLRVTVTAKLRTLVAFTKARTSFSMVGEYQRHRARRNVDLHSLKYSPSDGQRSAGRSRARPG